VAEYTKVHAAWADHPNTSTPVTAAALNTIEEGIANAVPKDAVTVAGTRLVSTKLLAADTYPAFKAMGDGALWWGAGGASDVDINLYRGAANFLKTDDAFVAGAGVYVGNALDGTTAVNGIQFGISTDTNLYRSAANTLKTDDSFAIENRMVFRNDGFGGDIIFQGDTNLYRAAAGILVTDSIFQSSKYVFAGYSQASGTWGFVTQVSGDTQPRFFAYNNGPLWWGDGTNAVDTTLYRAAANMLETQDAFQISRGGTGDQAFGAYVGGDSHVRFYVGAGGTIAWGSGGAILDTNLYRSAANLLKTDDDFQVGSSVYVASDGRVIFTEMSEPSNPTSNQATLFTKDNGSGKTQLCVRFSTGSSVVLATEA
jgi:hypothetical protein